MKEAISVQEFDFSRTVMAIHGKAFTTSQKIADYFGKSHRPPRRRMVIHSRMIRANAYFGLILTKDDFVPEFITPASLF